MSSSGRDRTLDSLEGWLTDWFERHLTVEELAGRTDEEWSSLLISDLYAVGYRVTSDAST